MTIRSCAIAASLLLFLTPAVVPAQAIIYFGPGVSGAAPVNVGSGHPGEGSGATVTPVYPVEATGCGADYAQHLIGQNANALPLPGHVRVIGPGTVVSFDLRPDRLNLGTDDAGIIQRACCG